jgi:4'-phosphopantetheinyl transferase
VQSGTDGTIGVGGPVVDDADVLVVWLDLALDADAAAALADTLSADERARTARLATATLRRRAIVRLGRRRQVLGELLGVASATVELGRDARGRLVVDGQGRPLTVSASSSADVGVLAVASGRRVGVDVEATGAAVDVDRFAARVSTPREAAALAGLEPNARGEGLARLWTRKEAYLKATGEGIGAGVSHLEVPIDDGLWDVPFHPVPSGPAWVLYDLDCPTAGFAAALVVEPGGSRTVVVTTR